MINRGERCELSANTRRKWWLEIGTKKGWKGVVVERGFDKKKKRKKILDREIRAEMFKDTEDPKKHIG